MSGPKLAAALALAVVILMLASVVLQPRRRWRDTAEHSKAFWLLWALGSMAIGAVPVAVGGWGWGEAAWLVVWCGCAALQPAMIVDVLDVRRQVRRRRTATVVPRAAEQHLRADETPISWRADAQS